MLGGGGESLSLARPCAVVKAERGPQPGHRGVLDDRDALWALVGGAGVVETLDTAKAVFAAGEHQQVGCARA